MPWTTNPKVTAVRRRSHPVDVVVEMLDGFRRHLTGRNAAVLTYYGFLTLFPLFLAASTILGFVLESKPEWRDDLLDSAIDSVPFIGDQIASGEIGGSWIALIIGLAGAMWGSLKAFVGIQSAYDDTWEIPVDDRSSGGKQRLKALIGLAAIGGSQVGNVTLAAIVDRAGLPLIGRVALIAGGLAINLAVVGIMYRFLTSADTTWRMILPGAVFTATIYTAAQFAGTALTTRILESAESYGDFAGVIALLTWLSLHALVNLFGAELNAAIVRIEARGPLPATATLDDPTGAEATSVATSD
ncbi:MAG: YihY/virulence factor BrkB family protein [Ilumatobacteraceae bacterium]